MKNMLKSKCRVFLDTNIVLDVLSTDYREHREASRFLFQAMRNEVFEGFITTQSIIDAHYVLSREKSYSMNNFCQMMLFIMSFVNVTQIDSLSIRDALKNPSGDFEDDAQFFQAYGEDYDVIVTSDRRFSARRGADGMLFMTPEELIARMS